MSGRRICKKQAAFVEMRCPSCRATTRVGKGVAKCKVICRCQAEMQASSVGENPRFGQPPASYSDYLKSEWWRLRRWSRLRNAKFRCEKCGAKGESLHVHHLNYDRLGRERHFDLMVLCEPCHKTQHPGWK